MAHGFTGLPKTIAESLEMLQNVFSVYPMPATAITDQIQVELCTAAAWRSGTASSPITSSPQPDGNDIHVAVSHLFRVRKIEEMYG